MKTKTLKKKTPSRQSQLIATKGFAFDPATHTYYYDGKLMTGVTTILGVLNKPALIGWAAKTAIEWVIEHSAKGEEEGQIITDLAILEDAKKAHVRKRDDAAQKGTDTHALVESWIKGVIQSNGGLAVYDSNETKYEPIKEFMAWALRNKIRFLEAEKTLYSKELWVAGTCDLVFEQDGKTYIGDIKTYAKIWDRTPFYQCAGYGLMWEEMHGVAREWEHNEEDEIDGYCVLRLSKDGTFEDRWSFDVEGDRKAFLACVEIYRQNAHFK